MKRLLYILLFFISANTFSQRRAVLNYQAINKGVVNQFANDISNFDTDYQAVLLEAIEIDAVLPTIAEQRLQNDIVLELKAQGEWTTHDAIYCFIHHGDFLFKSINWKNPTGAKLQDIGIGELLVDETGIQGDGANYIDTNLTLSNYTINDAYFSFDLVSVGGSNPLIQARNDSSTNTRILAANTFQYMNGSNSALMDFSTAGFYTISRSASNSVISSINGVVDETETFASTVMPNEDFFLFANGSLRGTSKLGFFAVGSNIDGSESDIYNAFKNAPAVTSTGGIFSDGYTPLIFSGDYGTYYAETDTYYIDKTEAGIVDGLVTDLVAKNNRKILTEAIRYGADVVEASTIKIDSTMDAYFNVTNTISGREYAYAKSIQIDADTITIDFTRAKLRTQPNKYFSNALVGCWSVDSLTIKNGFFYGDRYTHDYDPNTSASHDNGMGIVVYGGKRVTIDGIYTTEFTGDGLGIRSTAARNNDGTEVGGEFYTDGVDVINSTFTYNRRNGAAVTDGNDVHFDNCVFSYIGLSPESGQTFGLGSNGYIPYSGVDWEAIQSLEGDGVTLILTEQITNGKMTNCTFIGNRTDIDAYKVFGLEIAYNDLSSSILNVASKDVNIHHNDFDYNTTEGEGVAVLVSSVIRADDSNFTTGWQVTNNTINGYPTGLQIAGNGTIVNFNTITNYTQYGLYIRDRADDISVSNSSFTTSESGTTALYNFPAGITVDNADIVNCTFTGQQYGFNLLNISGSLSDDLNIDNCDFTGATKLQDVTNTTIQNSTYQTPISESGTNNVTYINNNP